MILPPDDYTKITVSAYDDGATYVRLYRRSTGAELGWAVQLAGETSWEVWAPDPDEPPLGRAITLRAAAAQLRHYARRGPA